MALEDGFIKIKTKIEGLAKSLSGIKDLGLAFTGIATIAKTVTGALKGLYSALDNLNQAYKIQAKAEVQLSTAIKNNPYLDSSSIRKLQDFAGQLQSISTIGDEQLLPFMAQLTATGRSESEIMQIMSAALDASASGMISLDEAVRGLNMSYSGQIGRLGQQIPALKNLTAEELKNGKAVEIVSKTYKGLAQETASATGSAEQLKNSWGDLKEEWGYGVEKALGPVRKFFNTIIKGWADAKKARREYEEGEFAVAAGKANISQAEAVINELKPIVEEYKTLMKDAANMDTSFPGGEEYKQNLIQHYENVYGAVLKKYAEAVKQYDTQIAKEREAKWNTKQEESAAAEVEKAANAEKKRSDFIKKSLEDRNKAITQLSTEANLRKEEVDAEKLLDIYVKSYLNLLTESEGMVTAESSEAKELLATIEKQVEAIQKKNEAEMVAEGNAQKMAELRQAEQEAAQKMLSDFQSQLDAISVPDDRPLQDQIADQRRELENFYDEIMGMETISEEEKESLQEEFTQKRIALIQMEKEAVNAALDSEKEKRKELANEALSQLVNTVNIMGNLAKENSQTNLDVKIAEIEAEELSEEEKNKKILEAQKKAAREQYRIELWQWTVSSLQAAANIAQGMSKCFAENGPWGFVTAALVAAAGAAQIATIIASKPQPPAFATGGIVPGNSYSGDRVQALVNSGEMILNRRQQAALFQMANGGPGGAGGTNINIKNYRANDVDVSASVTDRDIEIIIDKTVKKGLSSGRYDKELLMQQNAQNGTRISN